MLDQKQIFITGTDTGVGKSIFSALLALSYLNKGKKAVISKPIQTGKDKDTEFLARLTNHRIPIFNTYSFKLPAAPLVAARHEDKKIDVKKIISDIRKLEYEFDCVIVEGIGGIAVPIIDTYLLADLIKDLNYPVVVVARPTLGTINHTVLTIEFLKSRKLNVLGFVVSGYDEKANDPVIKTAPEEISRITKISCLMKIPYLRELNPDSIEVGSFLFSSNTPNCLANV